MSSIAAKTIFFSNVMVTRKRNLLWGRRWRSLDIKIASGMLFLHVLALFAPSTFSWDVFWKAVLVYFFSGILGISICYHRLLAHHSLSLPKWLEYTCAYLGVQTIQGVRTSCFHHITFLVNSACHIWGRQAWNTDDLSRNNWWVAMITFGEGWHNNHHAFEYSARHGLEWWQIDMSWYMICFLKSVGLATNVKLPTQAHMLKKSFAYDSKFK
ncbi:hypothetical protein L1987_49450 [Smallanthus sonchifolius]|uniref:Uncharacterized protein n=1 Tax=Smallanthus sonchifolius TaxID=185202 RepID=A0ACB9FUJ5_9ASTR|nr:hypothetical protein L1987_49450 [Smallanthus sonchifolius]